MQSQEQSDSSNAVISRSPGNYVLIINVTFLLSDETNTVVSFYDLEGSWDIRSELQSNLFIYIFYYTVQTSSNKGLFVSKFPNENKNSLFA